ncbi:cation channel sperm-associated auxiliary subunit delta-like [Tubulanus polymorphus]|uniref:cation channel sperm-associated auxiliary subunit delta-like n=1 Tax=Tubulanus polymorphus TaxID=672921 RepID=UPI003DA6818F
MGNCWLFYWFLLASGAVTASSSDCTRARAICESFQLENNAVSLESTVIFEHLEARVITLNPGQEFVEADVPYPTLEQDWCDRRTLVYVWHGIYISVDGFRTSARPLVLASTMINGTVTSLVVQNGHLIMAAGGQVVIYTIDDRTAVASTGLGSPVNRVVASFCCVSDIWCRLVKPLVVAYDQASDGSGFYLSEDGGKSFQAKQFDVNIQGPIYGMALTRSFDCIIGLKKIGNQGIFSRQSYRADNYSIPTTLPFTISNATVDLRFVKFVSEFGSLLLWDDNKLYYSPNAGQTVLPIEFHADSRSVAGANIFLPSEKLRQVITSESGEFAALTTDDRILFGREGFRTLATEIIDSDYLVNNRSLLSFTENGNIEVLQPIQLESDRPARFKRHLMLVHDKMLAVTPPLERCRYQSLDTNYTRELLYIDKGELFLLETTLTAKTWEDNILTMSVSNQHLVKVRSEYAKNEITMEGTHTQVLLTSLTQENKHDAGVREDGLLGLRSSLVHPSLECDSGASQAIGNVVVGCPPSKHIKIRSNATTCAKLKNYDYTVTPADYDLTFLRGINGKPSESLSLHYNNLKYGCPIKAYVFEPFLPTFDLYDGDKFIEQIKADFVLYEINGIHAYKYGQTFSEARCKQTTQSWKTMLQQQTNPDPRTAWTRQNYVNCTKANNFPNQRNQSFDDQFEVLCADCPNRVEFTDLNGIFIFEAIVVDPDYSFCDLRTRFSVEVYGASLKQDIPELAITGVVSLICVVVVYLSFIALGQYRRWRAKYLQEQERLYDEIMRMSSDESLVSEGDPRPSTAATARIKAVFHDKSQNID